MSNFGFAQTTPTREWRAVWIATVNNIDWPSKPGLKSEDQKRELIYYLDLFKSLNFNAIVLQVRPTADAFYISNLESWSQYLTGVQGQAPNPLYDPLSFAIEEAHKRGMELHAWLNPYRVSQDTSNLSDLPKEHIARKAPELFVKHTKKYYFDPAYPQTREFLSAVVKDLITRYDLDGIHLDDYFYPNNDFNDTLSFKLHNRGYTLENKMEWRRENVDLVVKMIHDTVKTYQPRVKFGISPYAVWRNSDKDPRGSNTKSYSYTNYDHLHADILKWMEMGWVDYIVPQLYFNIGYPALDFDIVSKWWSDYSYSIPLYAGLASYRLDSQSKIVAWRSVLEISNQIDRIRSLKGYFGACYFSAVNFKVNKLGINFLLKEKYKYPAISPILKGFDTTKPKSPTYTKLTHKDGKTVLSWQRVSGDQESPKAQSYVVYRFKTIDKLNFDTAESIICITGENRVALIEKEINYVYYVSALDKLSNESDPVKF